MQVALILGVCGGCRVNELLNLKVDDIVRYETLFHVNLRETKNGTSRSFTIDNSNGAYIDILTKYEDLRLKTTETNRFFVNYQRGKCTKQPIGKNKLADLPKQIATYLNLAEPERYTGNRID